jgi:hypothetical protein
MDSVLRAVKAPYSFCIKSKSPSTQSSLENPFEYTKNLVESFAWAKSGLTRTDTAIKFPLNNTQAIADPMFQIKLADIDYNHALREIESFRQSKNDAIQLSSDGAYKAYRGLIDAVQLGAVMRRTNNDTVSAQIDFRLKQYERSICS